MLPPFIFEYMLLGDDQLRLKDVVVRCNCIDKIKIVVVLTRMKPSIFS